MLCDGDGKTFVKENRLVREVAAGIEIGLASQGDLESAGTVGEEEGLCFPLTTMENASQFEPVARFFRNGPVDNESFALGIWVAPTRIGSFNVSASKTLESVIAGVDG